MKKLLIVILFFSSCAKGQSGYLGLTVQDTSHALIIIAGESNAGGYALNSDPSAYELEARSSEKILNNLNFLFEPMQIGVNNLLVHYPFGIGTVNGTTHGIENGLANSADSLKLGRPPVYIMKAGVGGSTIMQWVNPDSAYDVNGWTRFKQRADTAIKLLTAVNSGHAPNLYLIWTQGINDSIYHYMTSAVWKDSTKSMFTQMRARYGHMPIFITYLPATYTTYNTQITALGNEVSECYPIITSDAALRDTNHWSYAGWKIIATRVVALINLHYTL